LSPAKVLKVEIFPDNKSALVVVPDYQLSLSIGKEGQNVRLAAKLSGWKIDIISESRYNEKIEEEKSGERKNLNTEDILFNDAVEEEFEETAQEAQEPEDGNIVSE